MRILFYTLANSAGQQRINTELKRFWKLQSNDSIYITNKCYQLPDKERKLTVDCVIISIIYAKVQLFDEL